MRISDWSSDVCSSDLGTFRGAAMVWAGVALVLLAGSRHLITRGIPAVGALVELSTEPMDLLRSFASGWRTAGLGPEASAPTAFGLFGSLGVVPFGTMGLLPTILPLGLLPQRASRPSPPPP